MNLTEQGLRHIWGFKAYAYTFEHNIPFLALIMCGPEEAVIEGVHPLRAVGGGYNTKYRLGPDPCTTQGTFWGAILMASYPAQVRRGGWITLLEESLAFDPMEGLNWTISVWRNVSLGPDTKKAKTLCIDPVYSRKQPE